MTAAQNPALGSAVIRTVFETRVDAAVPFWRLDEWTDAYPWLVQGVTGRAGEEAFDMSLFGESPTHIVHARWADLRLHTGLPLLIHSRQVHGASVLRHDSSGHGLLIAPSGDGHATRVPGVLLTVTVADCVPIAIVDPGRRAIALLHAGWRGVAGGILEEGMRTLGHVAGSGASDTRIHFGPAICGACYEVGPEVLSAVTGRPASHPAPLDLRARLAERATRIGVPPRHITVSGHCTRCGVGFHSHRAGARERQLAVLGVRPDPDA